MLNHVVKPTYTITFKDYDGTVIKVIEVKEGEIPSIDTIPFRSSDDTYEYVFDSWGNIVRANGDATYQAKYNNILINSIEDIDNKTINNDTDKKDTKASDLEGQYFYINFIDDDGTIIESK